MRSGPIVVLLALLLAGCASHQRQEPAGGAPPHTVTKTFAAYRSSGELAVHVRDVASGHCWTASIAAAGSKAYRCIAGNAIYDPCFAPPVPTTPLQVACVADPWSDAEVVQVTGALPATSPAPGGPVRPWAVQLANGTRCVAATGTVPQVHGENLGYHCRNGADAALHGVGTTTVTADYAAAGSEVLHSLPVAILWQG